MILFFAAALAVEMQRTQQDATFIKMLDDSNMRETIKKVKNAFVMFHADHLTMSDVAYTNYVDVANQYKEKADFYVVPASAGSDVARTYGVPGSPALLHFRYGTRNCIHNGMFSHRSIENFVSNWTRPAMKELTIEGNYTADDVYIEVLNVFPDSNNVIIILADEETQFGRAAFNVADELRPYFSIVNFRNPEVAKVLGVRFPSIVVMRFEDMQRSVYTDEADADSMFIWIQRSSIAQFRRLELEKLFSMDGVALKSTVVFVDTNNQSQIDDAFFSLGTMSNEQQWIRGWYADITESAALANLLKIESVPATAYISANFTHIGFLVEQGVCNNATVATFIDDGLNLEYVRTPPAMHGDMRPVTEFAFERMLEEGPFFTLFNSAFCVKCKTMKTAAFDAARTIRRNGGNVRWASWDITLATPSFQRTLDIGIPSVWYFPDGNITNGVPYEGPQNFLSIVEWVANKQPEALDVEKIMAHELGDRFDEI